MVNRDLELLENESIYRVVVNGGVGRAFNYLNHGGVADHAHHMTTALPHSPIFPDLPTALM